MHHLLLCSQTGSSSLQQASRERSLLTARKGGSCGIDVHKVDMLTCNNTFDLKAVCKFFQEFSGTQGSNLPKLKRNLLDKSTTTLFRPEGYYPFTVTSGNQRQPDRNRMKLTLCQPEVVLWTGKAICSLTHPSFTMVVLVSDVHHT